MRDFEYKAYATVAREILANARTILYGIDLDNDSKEDVESKIFNAVNEITEVRGLLNRLQNAE